MKVRRIVVVAAKSTRYYAKQHTRICYNEKCRKHFKGRANAEFCCDACRVENFALKITRLIELYWQKFAWLGVYGLTFDKIVWVIKNDVKGAQRVAAALGYEWSNYGQVWRKING